LAYSVSKTWIPGEILTAADLNAGFVNDIAACNDLDSRVTMEVTARTVLEAEHDQLVSDVWNAGTSEIATNRVGTDSIKDASVTTAKILDGNVTLSKLPAGVLAANDAGWARMASGYILDTKVHDVSGSKLWDGSVDGGTKITNATITGNKLANAVASTALVISADTERAWNSQSAVKRKEIYCPIGGTLRIKFTLRAEPSYYSYGCVYRNGVAVGVWRSVYAGTTEFSDEIAGWSSGDLIQLYGRGDYIAGAYCSNFRIYAATPIAFGIILD